MLALFPSLVERTRDNPLHTLQGNSLLCRPHLQLSFPGDLNTETQVSEQTAVVLLVIFAIFRVEITYIDR
jgi:hypothetical protein